MGQFNLELAVWFPTISHLLRSQYRTDLERLEPIDDQATTFEDSYQLQALIIGQDRSDSNAPLDLSAWRLLVYKSIDYINDIPTTFSNEGGVTTGHYPLMTRTVMSDLFWENVPAVVDVDFNDQEFSVAIEGAVAVLEMNWIATLIPEPLVRP